MIAIYNFHFNTQHRRSNRLNMFIILYIVCTLYKVTVADVALEDVQFLNEFPLDKLLRLRSSIQEIVTETYENISATTPSYLQSFGAQAMAMKAPPIKRTGFEELHKKDGDSKVSNIFSMSVTTLAFLAFGGYLLCLIVQAIKAKESYNNTTVQPTTFFVNAGLKKKPQSQFASYGRRRREHRSLKQLDLPPEQLFSALLQLCEGYAKWSGQFE